MYNLSSDELMKFLNGMKEKIQQELLIALQKLGISPSGQEIKKLQIEYPEPKLGDYSSNAALILAKNADLKPLDLARTIADKIPRDMFEKVEAVAPGFINFWIKTDQFLETRPPLTPPQEEGNKKILLEYFQPNIAKPLHIGHMRTAIIGDCLKRMLKYAGMQVESDTHMGDWGTQFGFLILAVKTMTDLDINEAYIKLNDQAESDPSVRESAKQEFVKLEQGDKGNRRIWKNLVDSSVKKFLHFAKDFGLLPFDHHWPESFYEDKMPAVVAKLKEKGLLTQSQGAWIVNLETQGLGIAIIIKSDGGTTYLLRDLATFIFGKQQGFSKHLYVVDNRQSLHYQQLFAILKEMGEIPPLSPPNLGGETMWVHIDYGFITFKGELLSTRKGNNVLLEDVITQAKKKVAEIIREKNPNLKDKEEVIDAVAKSALKFFDLSHNRHSEIEFVWEQALDFEGKSGPYIQYTYARLASILRKGENSKSEIRNPKLISQTERRVLFLLSIFDEKVHESLTDYLPNIFADYLYDLANHLNRFYHESPVISEPNLDKKAFRLGLVLRAKNTLKQGMELLGIRSLEEM